MIHHDDFNVYNTDFNSRVNHFNLLCYTAVVGFGTIAAMALVTYGLDYCSNRFARNNPQQNSHAHIRAA